MLLYIWCFLVLGFGGPMPPQMPPRPMGGYMMQQPPQMPPAPPRPAAPPRPRVRSHFTHTQSIWKYHSTEPVATTYIITEGYVFIRVCLSNGGVFAPLHAGIHPPGQTPPRQTPPTRHPPRQGRHPPVADIPPAQCLLGYTGNKRILLECILVIRVEFEFKCIYLGPMGYQCIYVLLSEELFSH